MRRITRSTSTRFTNSSSAATVDEQWPKPCMPSFLDDLGILIRRHDFFIISTMFPNISYTHMTIGYILLLATVQEVTARMFTTTLRSQPIYSMSRLSELLPLESPDGSTIRTQSMQVTETPPLADGFLMGFACLADDTRVYRTSASGVTSVSKKMLLEQSSTKGATSK